MNKGCIGGLVAGGILLLLVLMIGGFWASTHNRIVVAHEGIDAAWAQVETVLQRRYDLIPNFVATVKGYAKHERETLENVTRYRSQWGAAKTPNEKIAASNGLEGALSRLLIVAERYPDLKANANFTALQDELAGTENRIAVERRRFNETVQAYNRLIRQFPANLIANLEGYERSTAYFNATDAAEEAPKVAF
jgi:LemA protein